MIETDAAYRYSAEEIERFRAQIPSGAIFCLEESYMEMQPENEAERLFLAKRGSVRIMIPVAWYAIPTAKSFELRNQETGN
jgi:hypothetical protein